MKANGRADAGRGQLISTRDDRASSVSIYRTATDRFRLDFEPPVPRPLRVLQLTDTHFGHPHEYFQECDVRTYQLISSLVDTHQPDFIVHTGDFIDNDAGPDVRWDALDFMNDLEIPWTHTLGNHDLGARPIEDYRKAMKHAAFGYFDRDEHREYTFRIDLHTQGKPRPDCTLFCFDSGHRESEKHVSRRQLYWLCAQLEQDRAQGATGQALAMLHIPLVEFAHLGAASSFRGNFGEPVCFESDCGETFAAVKRSNRFRAVFSGHDHANDYCGHWENIELIYGRVGGWACYGDLERGGRMIEIDLDSQTYRHTLVFAS